MNTGALAGNRSIEEARAPLATAVLAIAAAKLLFHLLTANRYGIFRDEMYGLACADHLAWGYPDHPPGGIWVTWIARRVFGDSLLGLRLLPALAGGALVGMTGWVTREIGGGPFAQALAALAIAVVPIYALLDHWLMMNAFEPLLWLGCLVCVLRLIRGGAAKHWIWFGLLAGVGIEFKYSMVFLVAGALAGLALTPQRHLLAQTACWMGLVLCGVLALPNFLWQARHGFPFLELMHNVRESHRDVARAPLAFLADQAFIMHPALAPLWIGGIVWLLAGPARRQLATFGYVVLVVIGAFLALHGKNYYSTPVYPIALAAGAVALESLTRTASRRAWRVGYALFVVVTGLALLPIVSPVFSPEGFLRYQRLLRINPPAAEHQNTGPLPQYFADEFGWEDMVREVARVYHGLDPAEQRKTAIFCNGWGEAAAVDYFGPRYGLPRAICKHNSYWYWGPGDYTGEIMIILHTDGSGDRKHFARVDAVGRVQHPYSRRDEWFDIYLCRGLNVNLKQLWRDMRLLD